METSNETSPLTDMSRSELVETITEIQYEVQSLREGWDDAGAAMLRLRGEDQGWRLWGSIQNEETKGFALEVTQQIADQVSLQCTGNPLLKQGFQLRFGNTWGKGVSIDGTIRPRVQKKLDLNSVQRVLWSSEAYESNERALYETGNLIVAIHRTTGESLRIPFDEISEFARNPNDSEDIWYFQRTYSRRELDGRDRSVTEWYPVLEYAERAAAKLPTRIGQNPVNREFVIVDMRVNRPTGGTWGIADAFAAMGYAWAYSEYIRDASSMLKALNTIAWKVVNKNKASAMNAGVRAAGAKRVGSTAVMTTGEDLVSMPRAGQIDMDDGRALAAMTASALGVPFVALTSDTSTASGYGAVQSLDGPTAANARARQEKWMSFYARVFRALGAKELELNFPTIVEDPTFRRVASLSVGRTTGALFADEYRDAYLEAMNIVASHEGVPDVEEYAGAANALGFIQMMRDAVASDAGGGDPLARQGNSGVDGRLNALVSDNSARDQEAKPGTGSVA